LRGARAPRAASRLLVMVFGTTSFYRPVPHSGLHCDNCL
jgi:hypothetical protein